ncbi:hypothetical protein ABPG75_012532 [Micractinium tetrahymenae]
MALPTDYFSLTAADCFLVGSLLTLSFQTAKLGFEVEQLQTECEQLAQKRSLVTAEVRAQLPSLVTAEVQAALPQLVAAELQTQLARSQQQQQQQQQQPTAGQGSPTTMPGEAAQQDPSEGSAI